MTARPSAQPGTALITGASSGIGATYAERLARRGHDLLLVARDRARLDALAARLRADTGVAVEVLPADLTQRSELAAVERRLREDARITMLVNNAGIAVAGSLVGADPDRLEAMIQLNVVAPTRLAAAVAPRFAAAGGGTLINVASVLALAPEMFNGSYSGTKAYVLNLSQALQHELAPRGVRVQAVLPGATATEFWDVAGMPVHHLPQQMVMSANDLVDAALAGLDLGETVTIPSLPNQAEWDRYEAARRAMSDKISSAIPAPRYNLRNHERVSA